MKSFRKYLKEDVDINKNIDAKNSVGIGIECLVQASTNSKGQTEFGVIFGAWNSGSEKTFHKVVDGLDDSAAHNMADKDSAAIKSIVERITKEADDKIKQELKRLGYK